MSWGSMVGLQAYEQLPLDDLLTSRVDPPDPLPEWRQRLVSMVECRTFQVSVACIIICNAIVIGFETDSPNQSVWEHVENLLLLCFTIELVLRFIAYGWVNFLHFSNPEFTWNSFDAGLVTIGVADFMMDNIFRMGVGDEGMTTIFRIFRLLRVLRIFRLIRFLKQLYILTYGFALAAMAVFWVTLLMGCALYICAIVLVRTYGHMDEGDDVDFFSDKYGTIWKALFSLFQLMMQPNLLEYKHMLGHRMPLLTIFLVFFVIFGSFGMIALLTGVITEAMFEKNVLRQQEELNEREVSRKTITNLCSSVFNKIPTDQYGEASREAVQKILPKVKEMLDNLNPKYVPTDLDHMLEVMDTDGSGAINKTEFCRGLLHLAEKSEDLQPMLMMELQQDAIKFVKNKVDSLESSVRRIEKLHAEVLACFREQQAHNSKVEARVANMENGVESPDVQMMPSDGLSGKSTSSQPRGPGNKYESERSLAQSEAKHTDPSYTLLPTRSQRSDALTLPSADRGASLTLDEMRKLLARIDNNTGNLQGQMFSIGTRMEEVVSDARSEHISSELSELAVRRRFMESESQLSARLGECEAASRQTRAAVDSIGQQVSALTQQVKQLSDNLRLKPPS